MISCTSLEYSANPDQVGQQGLGGFPRPVIVELVERGDFLLHKDTSVWSISTEVRWEMQEEKV